MGSSSSPSRADQAVTSIRIERTKLDRFREIAAANRRSVSQELRWLIDQHVDQHEREAA